MRSDEGPQGFWGVVVGFFRFLFTLLIILLIIAAIGAGLYYGVPWVYANVIEPIQDNSSRITALETELKQLKESQQQELRTLREETAQLEADLTALNEQLTVQAEAIEAMKSRLQRGEKRLTQLEGCRSRLDDQLAVLEEEIKKFNELLGSEVAELRTATEEQEATLLLFQSAQDLLHVRLLLAEDNPRGARDALAVVRAHLEASATLNPDWKGEIDDLMAQVDQLDQQIASHSFRVNTALDALWAAITDFATQSLSQSTEMTASQPIEVTISLSPLPTPTPPAP